MLYYVTDLEGFRVEDKRKKVVIHQIREVSNKNSNKYFTNKKKSSNCPYEKVVIKPVTVSSTSSNTKPFSFLRLLKSGVKAGVVYLCIYLGATLVSDSRVEKFVINRDKSEELSNTEMILDQVQDNLGIDATGKDNLVLFYAVMNNDNLESEEKDLYYSFCDLLNENPYLDIELSYDNLDDLDIVYTNRPSNYSSDVMGIFSLFENRISIFRDKNDDNREILIHEMIHSIFNTRRTCYLPSFFTEGVTELLTNEYFTSDPFVEKTTYPFEIAAVKLLCEMVGSEKVLNCYTTGNKEVLVKELSHTMGEDLSSQFLKNMETVFNQFQNREVIDSFSYEQMISYIDIFFATKFSENNDQTMAAQYYYYRNILELMRSDSCFEDYFYYIYENGVFEKPYFSKKLKQRYPLVERVNVDGTPYTGTVYQYTLG